MNVPFVSTEDQQGREHSLIVKDLYRYWSLTLKRRRCQTRFGRNVYSTRSSTLTGRVVGLFFEKTSEKEEAFWRRLFGARALLCLLHVNATPSAPLPAI
jgi:hypothetical protein